MRLPGHSTAVHSCSHGLSSYQVSFLIVKGMPSRSFLLKASSLENGQW